MSFVLIAGEADADRNAGMETVTSRMEVFLTLVLEISRTTKLDPMRMRDRSSRASWLWRSRSGRDSSGANSALFPARK